MGRIGGRPGTIAKLVKIHSHESAWVSGPGGARRQSRLTGLISVKKGERRGISSCRKKK